MRELKPGSVINVLKYKNPLHRTHDFDLIFSGVGIVTKAENDEVELSGFGTFKRGTDGILRFERGDSLYTLDEAAYGSR